MKTSVRNNEQGEVSIKYSIRINLVHKEEMLLKDRLKIYTEYLK